MSVRTELDYRIDIIYYIIIKNKIQLWQPLVFVML